jgi:hypothetical protein
MRGVGFDLRGKQLTNRGGVRLKCSIAVISATTLLTYAGCGGAPAVKRFNARPAAFCGLPQTITLDWQAVGTAFILEASPVVTDVSSLEITNSGERNVRVNADSTTFTLTATGSGAPASRSATVARLNGGAQANLPGESTCSGGAIFFEGDVPDTAFSRDVVVNRISNSNLNPANVTTPRGDHIRVPGFGDAVVPPGTPFVGHWVASTVALPPCSETRKVVSGISGLRVNLSCP